LTGALSLPSDWSQKKGGWLVVPTHREAEAVLALWREIERALDEATPGSREYDRLAADAVLLRDEYQRIVAAPRSADAPSLPEGGQPA
jgi:hypothetical protein